MLGIYESYVEYEIERALRELRSEMERLVRSGLLTRDIAERAVDSMGDYLYSIREDFLPENAPTGSIL